jgi:hypothetical protein
MPSGQQRNDRQSDCPDLPFQVPGGKGIYDIQDLFSLWQIHDRSFILPFCWIKISYAEINGEVNLPLKSVQGAFHLPIFLLKYKNLKQLKLLYKNMAETAVNSISGRKL